MSGICALYRFDGAPGPGTRLAPVLDALRDWGDASSSWVPDAASAPIALGCRMQAITPEDARDHQPRSSRDGACVLVADARVDNRADLAAALGIGAGDARTMPDSEFILRAWAAWGEDCARRLVGDFAFILWDSRCRSVFAARDGIGQRVLFYHRTPQWLSIASSPTALLCLEHVPATLNEEKLADFLVLLQDPVTTFYRDIHRLPAGHAMRADENGIRLTRFWEPTPSREIRYSSDNEYCEAFRAVFGEAVRCRLRSRQPAGIMLSAGLDSSTVAAMAAQQLRERGDRLHAFHAAPQRGHDGPVRPGWVADESEDVRAIARMYDNIDLEIQRPGARTPLDDLDSMFQAVGMPVRNVINRAWVDSIYLTMKGRSMNVLLSGQKGNATISYTGLRSLRDMARAGQWAHVLREIRAVARSTNQRPRAVLKDQILIALAPLWLVRAWSRLRRRTVEPEWAGRHSAIRPQFAAEMRTEERIRAARDDDLALGRAGGLEYRAAVLSAGDALDFTHGMRAWSGVETRDPTSDVRVVEFCLGIPGSQYLSGGRNRLLVRRSMRGLLPDAVLNRETRGAQASDWTAWLPALRPQIAQSLDRLDRSETARRCLDLARMRSIVERWPDKLGVDHMADYMHLLLRGIMTGRFITWFEETYG